MSGRRAFRIGRWSIPLLGLAIVLGGVSSPASARRRVHVENPADFQASEPFNLVATASISAGSISALAGSFVVPEGRVLILDGATADAQSSSTIEELAASIELRVTIPGQEPTGIATDPKLVNVSLDGGMSYVSKPVSSALPPMQLPPGTSVSVTVLHNDTTFGVDYRVIVSGHLVPALAAP